MRTRLVLDTFLLSTSLIGSLDFGETVSNGLKCNANIPLFREAIILRDEAARLLGYPDHASFQIEDKMAKTPKTVLDFLGDLRTQLTLGSVKEIKHLKDLKKQDLKSRCLEADGNFYL